jgi:hypothetical protein
MNRMHPAKTRRQRLWGSKLSEIRVRVGRARNGRDVGISDLRVNRSLVSACEVSRI